MLINKQRNVDSLAQFSHLSLREKNLEKSQFRKKDVLSKDSTGTGYFPCILVKTNEVQTYVSISSLDPRHIQSENFHNRICCTHDESSFKFDS